MPTMQVDRRLDRRIPAEHLHRCLLPDLWRRLWLLGGCQESCEQRQRAWSL